MIRVFLDANILFSAAYREKNGFIMLWEIEGVQLVTSPYAFEEVHRNITRKRPEALERLLQLTERVEVCHLLHPLKEVTGLPAKDIPILESASACGCQVLLTGDVTHFGHLMDTTPDGVEVMTTSVFLKRYTAI